jgi:aspartate aminotransferase-like enzyme
MKLQRQSDWRQARTVQDFIGVGVADAIEQARIGERRIGMPLYTPEELMSPVLTAAYVPEGVTSSRVIQYMTDVHKIKISTGLGELKEKIIRIGHMSPTTSDADIDAVVQALSEFR